MPSAFYSIELEEPYSQSNYIALTYLAHQTFDSTRELSSLGHVTKETFV